jgi:hypothetical protein
MQSLIRCFFTLCAVLLFSLAVSQSRPVLAQGPQDVLISEFRHRGANGALDEYVELYNNTNSDITVSTTDSSGGWTLVARSADGTSATAVAAIPNGTVLFARSHLLATGANYSLAAYAASDLALTQDLEDNSGFALFKTQNPSNFTEANRLDAVGFNNATGAVPDLTREGGGLPPVGTADGEYAHVRKLTSGLPQDTNDNAADFVFVSTTAGAFGGAVASVLGAPGPEGSLSPVRFDGFITSSLIDTGVPAASPPNRVRNGSGDSGTIVIRRQYTNTTAFAINRLRFRAVNITTFNSENVCGGCQQAVLALLSSSDALVATSTRGTIVVRGLTLEEPPPQPFGGGLNSSVTVALPVGGLPPGESIDVQFVLGVAKAGFFRFFVNVEALP